MTTVADFSSHVFSESSNPEVALVDAFQGPSQPRLKIADLQGTRWQQLRLGTSFEVRPGAYTFSLGPDSHPTARLGLDAKAGMRYTVLRVGTEEAHGGPNFPEELVLFPSRSSFLDHSAAERSARRFSSVLAVLASAWVAC
mmetsp:Transcript_18562/g.34285  ORF Transcript_18562/g.34285 Transcript_18562/m.34285 type:complete len:141 (+) Transcript_18562:3259-3681(+)